MGHDIASLDDTLRHNARLTEALRARVEITPLPVDPRLHWQGDDARIDVDCWTGPKIGRATIYRFFAAGRIKEHLAFIWPAEDYAYPALALVVFEYPGGCLVTSDMLPMRDVVFDPGYYSRYLGGYQQLLLTDWWPRLSEQRQGPPPGPNPFFSAQQGSSLAIAVPMNAGALELAVDYHLAVLGEWLNVHAAAEPVPTEERAVLNARRTQFMLHAYKPMDYLSAAAESLAKSVGWERTNLLFDTVFGPDEQPQPLEGKRTYVVPGFNA